MESTGGPWRSCLVRLRLLLAGRRWFTRRRVIHYILKFFAGFEVGNLLGWHLNPGPGLGIAADARLPLARAKAAETTDLDLVTAAEGLHDAIEDRLDNDLGFLAGHFHHA